MGWMAVTRRLWPAIASALIAGGAFGNIADRLRFGAVADFIDFHIFDRHWPAFNLADSCVVAGALLLIADAILVPEKKIPAPAPGGIKEV
jgi:signal peptidase II